MSLFQCRPAVEINIDSIKTLLLTHYIPIRGFLTTFLYLELDWRLFRVKREDGVGGGVGGEWRQELTGWQWSVRRQSTHKFKLKQPQHISTSGNSHIICAQVAIANEQHSKSLPNRLSTEQANPTHRGFPPGLQGNAGNELHLHYWSFSHIHFNSSGIELENRCKYLQYITTLMLH